MYGLFRPYTEETCYELSHNSCPLQAFAQHWDDYRVFIYLFSTSSCDPYELTSNPNSQFFTNYYRNSKQNEIACSYIIFISLLFLLRINSYFL